jgi:trehalose 6-phosphate synthase/phosphatase
MRFLSLFCASLLVTQKGLTLASSLQGVTKGLVAEKVLSSMISNKKPLDFVMCIGDDRSDEDMFESISTTAYSSCLPAAPEIFACTVGQKPSKARFYLDDTVDVVTLLQGLATASSTKPRFSTEIQVSFQNTA